MWMQLDLGSLVSPERLLALPSQRHLWWYVIGDLSIYPSYEKYSSTTLAELTIHCLGISSCSAPFSPSLVSASQPRVMSYHFPSKLHVLSANYSTDIRATKWVLARLGLRGYCA